MSPIGLWQRLTGKRPASLATDAAQTPEISYSDLFGAPPARTPDYVEPLPEPPNRVGAPAVDTATDQAIMRAWAVCELARWHATPMVRADLEQSFEALNTRNRHIFIYRFESGSVSMDEKPAALDVIPVEGTRAQSYLTFFNDAAKLLPATFRTILAMGVGDKVEFVPDVPVFAFQKKRGNVTILVPDIDFLECGFYEKEGFVDTVPYALKTDRAIFVGGTTGGTVTPEVARNCSLPRLRAAKYFWGHDKVEFLLPQIVQTSTPEARQILEEMPFCQGQRMSWKQQLLYRFLISVDGNGATCSRVAISLHSNSVLLKYDSEDLLYYFHGLQPWLHYIPISREQDVEHAFDVEHWAPGVMESVAAQGKAFAARFLTRSAGEAYMAQLLQLYARCFTDAQQPVAEMRQAAPVVLAVIAHVERIGDVSADAQGWVGLGSKPLRIEGFVIASALRGWREQVRYQAILPDGSMGPETAGELYCGTRGKQQAIHGFVVHIDAALPLHGLVYEGVFSDGFHAGPVPPGMPCQAPSNAALVAMRVSVVADTPSL